MFYRLKDRTGNHSQGGKIYKAGDVLESQTDLAKAFPFKFVRVVAETLAEAKAAVPPTGKKQPPAAPAEPAAVPPPPPPPVDVTKLGRDVTSRFPEVAEQDMKVFSVPGGFRVYAIGDLTSPLNPKLIQKKADVVSFVESHLKG